MFNYWLHEQGVILKGGGNASPSHEISRVVGNRLRVLHNGRFKAICFSQKEEDYEEQKKSYPLLGYRFYTDIYQDKSVFYYTIQDNHHVFAEKSIWHNFINRALEKLAYEDLTDSNIFVFTPYLIDPDFAKIYFKKLINYPDKRKLAFTYIDLCFPENKMGIHMIYKRELRKNQVDFLQAEGILKSTIQAIDTHIIQAGTNSTEIKKIVKQLKKTMDKLHVMASDNLSIDAILKEGIQSVQNIARHALAGWHHKYATSHLFGKGRHKNINWLYEQLNKLANEEIIPDPLSQIAKIHNDIAYMLRKNEKFVFSNKR
jgi:hypothetical protein